MTRFGPLSRVLLAIGLAAGSAGPAAAGFVGAVFGGLTVDPTPGGLNLNAGGSPGAVAFDERPAVAVAANAVRVDTLVADLPAGPVDAKTSANTFLPAGVYQSALIHFDRAAGTLAAVVEFTAPIAALVLTNSQGAGPDDRLLDLSDPAFGLAAVTYPTSPPTPAGDLAGRGLEAADALGISGDRRSLRLAWSGGGFDAVRVIGLAPVAPVPAPGGLALALLGLPALAAVHRLGRRS